jgi:hypothetical protein
VLRRALLSLSLTLTLAACGARAGLDEPSWSAGASGPGGAGATGQGGLGGAGGAAGSGGAGASGAAGGAGGAGLLCASLELVEPLYVPPPVPGTYCWAPWLVATSDEHVVALSTRLAVESPGPVPHLAARTTFSPWASWPPSLAQEAMPLVTARLVPFVASAEPPAPGEPSDPGSFAMAVSLTEPGCQRGALFDAPAGPLVDPLTDLSTPGTCEDWPLAVARSASLRLVSFDVPSALPGVDGVRRALTTIYDDAGGVLPPGPSWCARSPLHGQAIPSPDGEGLWLAHGVGYPSAACEAGEDLVPPDVARGVVLRRVGLGVDEASLVYAGVDDVPFVRLTPRSDGAWLVVRESGASAVLEPPALALRVHLDGAVGTPIELTTPGASVVGVGAFGDGLAVVMLDAIDPSAPTVIVRVFDASGALDAETSFGTSEAWASFDRLSVVAAPDGSSLLVGYAGDLGVGAAGPELIVRRLDCVPPGEGLGDRAGR